MKQPIFVISKADLLGLVEEAKLKYGDPETVAWMWGYRDSQEISSELMSLAERVEGLVDIASVAKCLNALRSGKMQVEANRALDWIIRQLKPKSRGL
jgi:hypothetical protein